MSSLAAIFNRTGSPVNAQRLKRMLDAIAHRGRDGLSRWLEGPVGFGHGALHTTPESLQERQPVSDGIHRLIWDGRLDNRGEISAALADARIDAGTQTDPELVLGAYQLWGTDCAVHLLGEFAFIVWDTAHRRLFAARDRLGLKPFYYYEEGPCLLIASEAKAILSVLNRTPDPDAALVLAMLLSEGREEDNHRSLFAGIHRLPPGHTLTADARGLTVKRYWKIDPARQTIYKHPQAYVEHFRVLFEEAVRARTRSAFPVGCFLSGGLDSSAIVATAAASATPIEAFNIFEQDPASDERVYARQVANTFHLPLWEFADSGQHPLQNLDDLLFTVECPLISNHSDLNGLDRLIASRQCRILLDGDGGDHLIDESGYFADLLLRANPARFLRETKRFAEWYGAPFKECAWLAMKDALPVPLKYAGKYLARQAPPSWINQRTARSVQWDVRLKTSRVPFVFGSQTQRVTYQDALSPTFLLKLELTEREAAAAGREIWFPFLDSRLVEFILSVPWRQRCREGERKWLLRQAMKDILPQSVRLRHGKGDGTDAMDRAVTTLCRATTPPEPLANRSGLLQQYVNLDEAAKRVRRYLAGQTELRWDVWTLVTLDHWLHRFYKGGSAHGTATIKNKEAVHDADVALVR